MKIKSSTIRVRRGGDRNSPSSRPTKTTTTRGGSQQRSNTRTATRGTLPYVAGGRPPKKSNQLLFVGLASCFGLFLLIIVIVAAAGSKSPQQEPTRQQRTAKGGKKRKPAPGQYGAKHADYDKRMVMKEESQFAKDRKKRRAQKDR
jgi:predicted lipid-binding transport protein (Tim44 family)